MDATAGAPAAPPPRPSYEQKWPQTLWLVRHGQRELAGEVPSLLRSLAPG